MISEPISLNLYNSIGNGSGSRNNVTANLKNTWRRSIRDVGGYWIGSARWNGTEGEMIDLFQNGMLMEIREDSGGLMTWQGFLAEMHLSYKGNVYTRSWADVANRVKVIYSKMGTNQITNDSCEAAVWDAYNSPTTRERSTTWATKGSYSAHVVADAANDGVTIQSSITITAGKEYQGHVTVNIVSGTWKLEIYRSDGTIVDDAEQPTAGQWVMDVGIASTNQTGGTVGLRLYCTTASGEIYADAAVFQEIATRAETSWNENANSQAEYGVIELILSEAGMTDAAANALAANTLNDRAWARVKPPAQYASLLVQADVTLDLTFLGYAYTLLNKYAQATGVEDEASTIITDLIAEAELIDSGMISGNTLSYYIEDNEDYRVWNLIADVTAAGDASGNRWVCGVYNGRKFYYEQASSTPVARVRDGRIVAISGAPLEGWLAQPGIVAIDDLPIAYDIGERIEHRLNMSWMNEVEFSLGDYLAGNVGITYRQTQA